MRFDPKVWGKPNLAFFKQPARQYGLARFWQISLIREGALMKSRQNSIARMLQGCRAVILIGAVGLLAACSHEGAAPQLDAAVKPIAVTKSSVRTAALSHKKPRYVASSQPLVIRLKTRTAQVAYGRGPYICSPSGFGRTSRCVAR
jgi:hypothetical protein